MVPIGYVLFCLRLMPFQGVQTKVPSVVDNLEIERIPSTGFGKLLFELIFSSAPFMTQDLYQSCFESRFFNAWINTRWHRLTTIVGTCYSICILYSPLLTFMPLTGIAAPQAQSFLTPCVNELS